MQEITLKLNFGQVNLRLEALGRQPYLREDEFIEVLQREAQAQLSESEPVGTSTPATTQA